MMFHALALAALVGRCAPSVAPSTMMAIVRVESGGDSLAIGDNTTRRSYFLHDRMSAESLAERLLNAGHSLDLGIAQIDSMNFTGFGVTVHSIFDACTNLGVGAKILSGDYAFAARRYGLGQTALRHAIGMYNTGRLNGGARYINRVLAAAGISVDDASMVLAPTLHQARYSQLLVRVTNAERAPRSPILVRDVVKLSKSAIAHRTTVTPARSPILVTIARAPHARIF